MKYKIQRDHKIAIIPARGGSKGVPGKNIKQLGGYPLIAYSIAAAEMSGIIDEIIVSTDSEEVAEIARFYGAEVPFLRPKEFATDQSSDFEFVWHALNWLQDNRGKIPEYLIHLRPTTPLRDPVIVKEAIIELSNNTDATSLRSAHLASESPYKWFVKNEQGFYDSIKKDLKNDTANNGRQAFPDVYVPDGYVDVLKCEYIINERLLHGDKILGFVSPVCVEVDTKEDFAYLEYQINKETSVIYEYLHANKRRI